VTKGKSLEFKELGHKEERKRDNHSLRRIKEWWQGRERTST
jgi:hypothetical protein